ncbi:hypothetical protein MMC26_001080 [Xylographa opegraphella]|nr:hypothetical protein [Xylographa opegraphella]
MTPCSNNTWGCGLECGTNTFPLPPGSLQISDANSAALKPNNQTAPSASSSSVTTPPTSTPITSTPIAATTPPTPAPAASCSTPPPPLPPPHLSTPNIIGICIGIPLGLAFALTALLLLHERRKLLQTRRALVLLYERRPAAHTVLHHGADAAKLHFVPRQPEQPPDEQSWQPPCVGLGEGDGGREEGGSGEVGFGMAVGMGLAEKMKIVEGGTLQELP